MANASTTGYGFRSVMATGSTPATQGQAEYQLFDGDGGAFNKIWKNDPVSLNDGGAVSAEAGFLHCAAFATTDDGKAGGNSYNSAGTSPKLAGIFNGAFYVDASTSKPTWVNALNSGTEFGTHYNTGSTNGIAFVIDNPNVLFEAQEDSTEIGASWPDERGSNANFVSTHAGSTKTGRSKQELASSDVGATAANFRVVELSKDPDNSDTASANCNFLVRVNEGLYYDNAAGIEEAK